MHNSFAIWEELVEVVDSISEFLKEFRFSWNSLSSFHEVEDIDWCTVSFKKIVEVQCCSTVEGINEVEFNGRLGCNASIVLRPVQRNAASMLDIGRIVWAGK